MADHFALLSVPLPPLAKQHRTVTKVDELVAILRRPRAGAAGTRCSHRPLYRGHDQRPEQFQSGQRRPRYHWRLAPTPLLPPQQHFRASYPLPEHRATLPNHPQLRRAGKAGAAGPDGAVRRHLVPHTCGTAGFWSRLVKLKSGAGRNSIQV